MEFSRVERAAIEAILSRPVDGMDVLRTQFAAASAVERDYTGVGFYTTISVPVLVSPVAESQELCAAVFDGAVGRVKSDPGGLIFFHLWLHGGYLACLEGYTIRHSWPNEDDIETVEYCQTIHKAKQRQFAERDLIPDCENRFEVWRMNVSAGSLLVAGLLGLFVVVVVLLVISIVV